MRVLRVLTRPNLGGPTRQAIALWHAHRTLGVRTLLAVGRCEDGEAALDPRAAGIPARGFDAAVAAGPDADGLVVVPGLRRGPSPGGDARALAALMRLSRSFAPHIVHTHTTKAGILGRFAARRGRAPVLAHTFHGLVLRGYFGRLSSAMLAAVERRLARRTDLLFAVSESCRVELDALGIRPVEVVPPAVDWHAFRRSDRASARRRLGLPDDAFVLGFVGRLVRVKRVDRFVELCRRLPGVVGLVWGDGPLSELVRAEPGVRWRGATPELAPELAACDLLVVPSDREGYPLCGVEAAAAGVPTIGFDVPGVRDLVVASDTGLVVPMTAGMDGLVGAVQRCRSFGRPTLGDASRRMLAASEPPQVAALLLERYRRALGTPDVDP
jgi:glycosyltransferase involved in cell wall biosynthesis